MNFPGFPLKGFPMPHYGRFPATVCTRDQSVSFIYPSQHGVQFGTFVLDHRYSLGFSPSKQRMSNECSFALCGISSARGGCWFLFVAVLQFTFHSEHFHPRRTSIRSLAEYPGMH